MSEDKYRAALDMAAKQLSYRALSAKMLRDKLLAKGHDEEAADYALAWLTERSLLNDTLFAENVVRSYTRKGYGAARIRQELTRRGIDRDTAEAAMQTFSPDEAQILALLEKRLRGDVSDRKEVEKAVAAIRCRRKNNKHPAFCTESGMFDFIAVNRLHESRGWSIIIRGENSTGKEVFPWKPIKFPPAQMCPKRTNGRFRICLRPTMTGVPR